MESAYDERGEGYPEPLGLCVGMPTHSPLDMAASAKHMANVAEISALLHTLDWAADNAAPTVGLAAAGDLIHPVPLSGEGTPLVREDALPELAAALGMSDSQVRLWVGDALELKHRLPRLMARLFDEQLPLWKARAVAQASRHLTLEGAAWLDKELQGRFERVGPTALKRFIAHAIDRFDPDEAVRRAETAAESRKVDVYPQDDGLTDVVASIDNADAKDLEAAVRQAAGELREQGSEASLDVRRSQALGVIARHYLTGGESADRSTAARIVNLYVHLQDGEQVATAEGVTGLRSISQVKEWCTASNTKVIVRPVLDLDANLTRNRYVPSDTMREQAMLIDKTCVAPHCERNARRADLDHITEWPRGSTESKNLACLCRYHHRIRTFTTWTYRKLDPGYHLWRSPEGRSYLCTPTGTIAL
ncbi:MAG: DUF222 domain-containing protein [Nocardioides sp.]|uniref:HNH endonuclease signature motif containing protein n=1 Tax=Nocardioides sp. TaxID=35761 RepID=UPI0039E68637